MENLAVVCADIGSVAKRRFAWWESEDMHGRDPSSLAARVGALLNEEIPVALGFESPLYVPLPEDENLLAKARPIDGNRAWSAGAGCGALATGLVQVAWVLESIRRHTAVKVPTAYLNWDEFACAQRGLLLWEAFVSGASKKGNHLTDAQAGAAAFAEQLSVHGRPFAEPGEPTVFSLVGAALLRTGWTTDVGVLSQSCPVVRA